MNKVVWNVYTDTPFHDWILKGTFKTKEEAYKFEADLMAKDTTGLIGTLIKKEKL